jgi:hypothetical protein
MKTNPEKGAEFATQLMNCESGPFVDVEPVINIFVSQTLIQPAASFLLDALKENKQGRMEQWSFTMFLSMIIYTTKRSRMR